jgi:hypothetical protein
MKIAPGLTSLVAWYAEGADFNGRIPDYQMRAELRALLAVARAAKRIDAVENIIGEEAVALHRALARLERASGGTQ